MTVYVTNGKGFGAGPNGGPDFHEGPEGTYIGDLTKGTVSVIPVPPLGSLNVETFQTLRNNGFLPPSITSVPEWQAYLKSPKPHKRFADEGGDHSPLPLSPPPPAGITKIHHVVLVVKENRTFDQVFGDLVPAGDEKIEVDRALVQYGTDVTVKGSAKDGTPTLEHADVTPNHHALARRFAVSDNYY